MYLSLWVQECQGFDLDGNALDVNVIFDVQELTIFVNEDRKRIPNSEQAEKLSVQNAVMCVFIRVCGSKDCRVNEFVKHVFSERNRLFDEERRVNVR